MLALVNILAALQLLALARIAARILGTARGGRVASSTGEVPTSVSVVVPVLNEQTRLAPCLAGLARQGSVVSEILVVDGGSIDATPELARQAAHRDPRIRLITAAPIPNDWNGKAWGLQTGWSNSDPSNQWLLFLDADTRPDPRLTVSLVKHAEQEHVGVLSVATRQEVRSRALGLLHPAMLTTLVYRLGIPGHATTDPGAAQANGQCMLVRRDALEQLGDLRPIRASRCEDVTLARILAGLGNRVGLYESDDLVSVEMYRDWKEAWHGWSRSLPLRDRVVGWKHRIGLAEVLLAQALPLPLLLCSGLLRRRSIILRALNILLLGLRMGVLIGTRRAYDGPPWTYWLSPLLDLPVSVQLWSSSFRSTHQWRGRRLVAESL